MCQRARSVRIVAIWLLDCVQRIVARNSEQVGSTPSQEDWFRVTLKFRLLTSLHRLQFRSPGAAVEEFDQDDEQQNQYQAAKSNDWMVLIDNVINQF